MRLFVVTSALLLGSYAAFAGPCLPGTLQNYITLGSTGCTAGVAVFKDFQVASGQSFATPIPPAQVQVTPTGVPSFSPALQFTINQSASAGELLESFFHFDVSAAGLRSAMMTLNNSSATGDGTAIASADICPGASFLPGSPTGCPTSPQSLITFVTATDAGLTDSKSFAVTSFFDVFTDLTIDGGLAGTASLGSATFQVTAVPEPAMGLLTLIACGALAVRRFRLLL